MRVKYALFFLAALPFAAISPALGHGTVPSAGVTAIDGPAVVPMPGMGKRAIAREPVLLAQNFDPRVTQLEEQIRQLNGRIEEMNFQILQMQEALRKAQEDNEFRIQTLEGKRSDATQTRDAQSPVQKAEDETPMDGVDDSPPVVTAEKPGALPGVDNNDPPEIDWSKVGDGSRKLGVPPRELGTLEVDDKGNVVGETANATAPAELKPGATDTTTVAALPSSDDPGVTYGNAYQFVLSGDYTTAEQGFRDYVARFPEGPQIADAKFWLGESLLGQERYRDAAEVFLEAGKAHPKARKAPDMMLKLGISMAALKQSDIACATYASMAKKFPGMSSALQDRVRQEQALAGC